MTPFVTAGLLCPGGRGAAARVPVEETYDRCWKSPHRTWSFLSDELPVSQLIHRELSKLHVHWSTILETRLGWY